LNETVVTENCQERLTCLPTGKIHRQNMSCESSEVCTTKNGVHGCYPRQCMVEAGGSFSLFSGETWNITSIGAYELVKACDGALEEEWFRVVVAFGSQNSVVAVYVYFEEVFITVTNKQSTW
ncbi:IgGFc-binding protein-like, partial [Clarias magur]